MKKLIPIVAAVLVPVSGLAYTVETKPGAQIFLSIPKDVGATLTFDEPVQALSGGSRFQIRAVGSEVDPKTRRSLNPQVFNVTASTKDADESVTFVFSPKEGAARVLTIRFRAKDQATNYYQIKFPKSAKSAGIKGFMAAETSIILSMIRDDDSFGKETFSEPLKVKNVEGLDITLIRRFESGDLTGYTLSVQNKTKDSLRLNLNALRIGETNRIAVSHAERETLLPSTDKTASQTKVYLVMHGQNASDPLEASPAFPFVSTAKSGDQNQ